MTQVDTPALAGILEAEKALLLSFLDALSQERDHLLAGKTEHLPTLAATKTELAAALERAETERRGRWGKALLRGEIETSWREIRELGGKAARANIENGVILAALTRHVEGALRIFTGAEEPYYGPAGSHTRTAGSRPLASA